MTISRSSSAIIYSTAYRLSLLIVYKISYKWSLYFGIPGVWSDLSFYSLYLLCCPVWGLSHEARGENPSKRGAKSDILICTGKAESGIYWLTKLYRVQASESASDPVTTDSDMTPIHNQGIYDDSYILLTLMNTNQLHKSKHIQPHIHHSFDHPRSHSFPLNREWNKEPDHILRGHRLFMTDSSCKDQWRSYNDSVRTLSVHDRQDQHRQKYSIIYI